MKKQIANVVIYQEGDDASMMLFTDADTDQEMVVAATYIARALLNVCEKMDSEAPESLAIKSLVVALKMEEERRQRRQIIEEGKVTRPC